MACSPAAVPADIGDFQDSRIVEPGQHRVVLALIRYFVYSFEVNVCFYFNLDVEPRKPWLPPPSIDNWGDRANE